MLARLSLNAAAGIVFLTAASAAWCQSNPTSNQAELSLPPSGKFVIGAWDGPAGGADIVEQYRQFADAGFTHSLTVFVDAESARAGMAAAQQAEVKVVVRYWPHSPTLIPPQMAKLFKDHPAMGGYMLQDEPVISEFPQLLARTLEVQAIDPDPNKVVAANLLPSYGGNEMIGLKPSEPYENYVYKYLSEVPVNTLCYDYYPLSRRSITRPWYSSLLIMRRASAQAKIPVWAIIATIGMDLSPDPTLGSVRVQVYNNAAMGATGLIHFLYRQEPGMRAAAIDLDGKRTPVYSIIQQVNRELQAQASVFVGSKGWYTPRWAGPNPPEGYTLFEPSGPIQTLTVAGKGALINRLEKDHLRFLVIVNQDFIDPMPLSIGLQPQARIGRVQKDGSVKMLTEPKLETKVDPGDAVILMWQAKGD